MRHCVHPCHVRRGLLRGLRGGEMDRVSDHDRKVINTLKTPKAIN